MSLKVTLVQTDLHWENVTDNLSMLSNKIAKINEATDIIVLPEMFNTGFSMDSEKLSETMDGETVTWIKNQAKINDVVIIGSLIVKVEPFDSDQGTTLYYNRLIWAQPDGQLFTYDKRHLFRMANEHNHFTSGTERLIVNYKGWKICPMVCYDLRFPVWSRNSSDNTYDLLLYIANWPAARKAPWSKLLEARAIENQSYVIGVNRVGTDGTGIEYSGNSVTINPKGEVIASIPENKDTHETCNLSLSELNEFRKAFPVGMDGDSFELTQ